MGGFSRSDGGYLTFEEVMRAQSDPPTDDQLLSVLNVVNQKNNSCPDFETSTTASCSDVEMQSPHNEVYDSEAKPMEEEADDLVIEDVPYAGQEFVDGMKIVLSQWLQTSKPHRLSKFHSLCVPQITIGKYMERIRKYFGCSDECFVLALVYIDRASKASPSMQVCELSVHRLLLIAVMIAAKYHDDVYYSNAYYSRVGGMSCKEANNLEILMLGALDWKTHVQPEDYRLFYQLVCEATRPVVGGA